MTALSPRERVAQMVFPDFRFADPDTDRALALVKAGVGGFCLFGGSRFDVAPLVNSLQNRARLPLLFGADYEAGAGAQVEGATWLPSNMAVGASGSEGLARLKGRVTAREAKALGVPWVLAPVVDVNSNPANPIINTRSFGGDPGTVGRLARAFVEGLREAGALSCAKHFPGHGDVDVDSHLALPRLSASRERLDRVELRPFQACGADSVMTAHLQVDALDPEHPASLSSRVGTLLRKDLGYDGLVSTDALMMGGITTVCSEEEALLLAVRAGADILLIPRDPLKAIDTLAAALESGRIDGAAVDRAVARIRKAKERVGLFKERIVDPSETEKVGAPEHETASDRIAEGSITKVSDAGLLPLKGSVRYAAMKDDGVRGDLTIFEKGLEVSNDAEIGVLAVFSSMRAFSGRGGTDAKAVADARARLGPVKCLVVVSFGTPYLKIDGVDAYVCAYGECPASQRAAARALRGEIPFKGTLPVRLL